MSATNIVLHKKAEASNQVMPYEPSKAVDGVMAPAHRWVGSLSIHRSPSSPREEITPTWLTVDLGGEFWVSRWVVRQLAAVGWPNDCNLCDYKLQGSFYSDWFDMDSVINNSVSQTDRPLQKPCKARFVRIYVTKGLRCNPLLASIVDLEVYAADPTSAKLNALTLNNATLDSSFESTTYDYTAKVGYNCNAITVTPATEDSQATIKVNGAPVTGGLPSGPISLEPGSDNLITVEVTPYVGDPQQYTIRVTRDGSPYLSNLTGLGELQPKFRKLNVGSSLISKPEY